MRFSSFFFNSLQSGDFYSIIALLECEQNSQFIESITNKAHSFPNDSVIGFGMFDH